jgi:hypothetical protein
LREVLELREVGEVVAQDAHHTTGVDRGWRRARVCRLGQEHPGSGAAGRAVEVAAGHG